jgi:hypothetical protein
MQIHPQGRRVNSDVITENNILETDETDIESAKKYDAHVTHSGKEDGGGGGNETDAIEDTLTDRLW